MGVAYRINADERIVYLTSTDGSSLDEWERVMLAALGDSSYEPGFHFLNDRRRQVGATSTALVRSAADFLKSHSDETGRFRWASVSSADADYGMQRMFSILVEGAGVEARAFRDYEGARRWLLGGD